MDFGLGGWGVEIGAAGSAESGEGLGGGGKGGEWWWAGFGGVGSELGGIIVGESSCVTEVPGSELLDPAFEACVDRRGSETMGGGGCVRPRSTCSGA